MFAQPVKALDRPIDGLLPVHLCVEKPVEQIPNLAALDNRAVMLMAQRFAPVAMNKVEMNVMCLVQPIAKRHDHMQQHFITIGYEQWP